MREARRGEERGEMRAAASLRSERTAACGNRHETIHHGQNVSGNTPEEEERRMDRRGVWLKALLFSLSFLRVFDKSNSQ
jgi:hypothetical protein